MALKIRLRQQGRTNRLMYRVVVADSRSPRDGKCVEMLGWYNPFMENDGKEIELDAERVSYWLDQGAQLSEKVRALLARSVPDILQKMQQKQMEKRAKAAKRRRAKREAS